MSVRNLVTTGYAVVKAAQNLPQTATATLFTLTNGAVLVTGLLGLVTTALGATVTTLSLGDSVGGVATIATAGTVTSKAAGTWYVPQQTAGAAGAPLISTVPFIGGATPLPSGISPFPIFANITWTTSASDTGQMKFYIWYVPIDADASVS